MENKAKDGFLDKIKHYYSLIVYKGDLGEFDVESRQMFLKFLDYLYNILVACFCIFGIISIYFFITHAIF